MAVVDFLEMIQVDEHDATFTLLSPCSINFLLQALVEVAAVGNLGQAVRLRLSFEFFEKLRHLQRNGDLGPEEVALNLLFFSPHVGIFLKDAQLAEILVFQPEPAGQSRMKGKI